MVDLRYFTQTARVQILEYALYVLDWVQFPVCQVLLRQEIVVDRGQGGLLFAFL